jgi:hypothetical protein
MNLENWQPYQPGQLQALLQDKPVRYWFAGSHALALFVGGHYRAHADLDIVILRADQTRFQQALKGFSFYAADPPGSLRPWRLSEFLLKPINDVWVKEHLDEPFVFQIMFLDTVADRWLFKRDPAITGLISEFGLRTPQDYPIIRPEIQLLYKAKTVREKDQQDFRVCLPRLNRAQKQWLKEALERVHPEHDWIMELDGQERVEGTQA